MNFEPGFIEYHQDFAQPVGWETHTVVILAEEMLDVLQFARRLVDNDTLAPFDIELKVMHRLVEIRTQPLALDFCLDKVVAEGTAPFSSLSERAYGNTSTS